MANNIDNRSKSQQKTTGFTNIQDVVAANRQNRLGSTVSSGVSGIVGQNKQALDQSKNQFQQQSQANQIGGDVDKAFVEQKVEAPDTSKETVDQFAKFRAGQYQGPQQLANKEQLQAGGQDIQGLAGAASNEYGRRGLLQRFVSPNQYTQGQQRLDNLLLGQTGGKALNQARREANLYTQGLSDADRAAQAQAQGLTEQAKQFGEYTRGRLGQEETELQADVDTRVSQQRKEAEDARAALRALYSKESDNITQEQYDAAKKVLERQGLADHGVWGTELLAGSPEEILGQGIIDPTRLTVGSEQEKAKSLALAKLAGKQQGLYSEADKVGGYDTGSFLDRNVLNKYLGQGQELYNKYDTAVRADQSRIKELSDYDRDLRALTGSPTNSQTLGYNLNQLKQKQATFLPDDPRYQELQAQIAPLQNQYNEALSKDQSISGNLRQRQLGLHLGEDEFAHGGGNYGMLMGQKLREAQDHLAKQQTELNKYKPESFLNKLKGLIK